MDSLVTTQISTWYNAVKVLHVEPTNVCQAECPLCLRETDPLFNKEVHQHLTVETLQSRLSEDFIANLDKMFMCGNYGDPAAGKYSLEIFKYFRNVNPNITLGMNTNGGLRNVQWWTELASITKLNKDYVVFSIDGLENTNHLYRKNVDWNKVIENVTGFIQAGGNAHWDMLVYQYNEHQVDQCMSLAKKLGFKWFRAKVSKRKSNIIHLQPPESWRNRPINSNQIDCFVLKEKSIYIDASGKIFPCCWLGSTDRTLDKFDSIINSWQDNCHPICQNTCSSRNNKTNFTDQWQKNIEL
jgi:MoaA/NifB/PqqE/SkfB family radical SAM enzyme